MEKEAISSIDRKIQNKVEKCVRDNTFTMHVLITVACIAVGNCGYLHAGNRGASSSIVESKERGVFSSSLHVSDYSGDSVTSRITSGIEEIWIEKQWKYTKDKSTPRASGGYQMIIAFSDSLDGFLGGLSIGKPPFDSFRELSKRHLIRDVDSLTCWTNSFTIMVTHDRSFGTDSVGYVVIAPLEQDSREFVPGTSGHQSEAAEERHR